MLQKIVLQCSFTGDEVPSYNWGSLMHGALMELLPVYAVEELHENSLHPFSQYLLPLQDNQLLWNIGTWGDAISDVITRAIMPLTEISLKNKGITLKVLSVNRTVLSEQDYLAQFFTDNQPCRRYRIEFLTPCTHKSNEVYTIFPSEKLILQSLVARFSAFADGFSLDDAEVLDQIVEHTKITYYSLHAAKYSLKGITIKGYKGSITLSLRGPEQLIRLTGLLLSFAEYAGIGVKTSLGMGGCRVIKEFGMKQMEKGRGF